MSRRQEDVIDAPSLIPAERLPAQSIDVNVQGTHLRLPRESLKLFRNLNNSCKGMRIAREGRYDFNHGFQLGHRSSPIFIFFSHLYLLI